MTEKNDDNIKRVCKACGNEKNLKSFHRNGLYKDGFDVRCKICKRQGVLVKERKPKKIAKTPSPLSLKCPTKEDYKTMFLFLERMGYDLNRDIHIQFCEKYNFKPKKRPYKSENFYTLEELFT